MITKFNVEKTKQLDKVNRVLSLVYRKPQIKRDVPIELIRNILIVDFALMGDMIMDIPFLKTIRHNCPNAKITMVCMTWGEIILGDQGLVDEFIIFDGKKRLSSPMQMIINNKEIRGVLKKINKKEYEIGFEPKGDLRHTLLLHYTNCLRTISYNYTGGEYLITDSFSPKPGTKHLIDEKIDLLEMCGFRIYEEDMVPRLSVSKDNMRIVDEFIGSNNLKGRLIIGIHPGASNVNKQYRNYPELIHRITKALMQDFALIIFEGPNEKEIVDAVESQAILDGITYYRVRRPTKEYVSLVSVCDYMICNDSAAGHIAAAYGIPSVIVFGAIYPEVAAPKGDAPIICVSHDLTCKPCTLSDCPQKTYECIRNIKIEEVFEAFLKALQLHSHCNDI